jgi:hypothetical protein
VTTNAEEVQFTAGFEREPEVEAQKPAYHDVTVTVLDSWVKKLWRADGFINRMLDSLSVLGGKVRTLADGRGPNDFAESDFERGMKAGSRLSSSNNYGGNNNTAGSSKLGWLITLNIAITLGVSSWVVKTIIDYGNRIVRIECRMDPQCVSVVLREQP